MNYYDNGDREKPTWREIDQMKDGTGSRKRKDDSEREPKTQRKTYAQMQYKKKLEEFFAVGKKKEDKVKLDELKKIMDIKNKNSFMKAAAEYISQNGMPKDFDFLMAMLDHKDSKIVCSSLDLVEEMFKDESDTRQEIIKQKVNILEMTSSDMKVQGKAEEILERIKN